VETARWTLDAIGVTLPLVDGGDHPNRLPFTGVLTRVDEPSDRPPNGARGHRVLLPAAVADRALATLIGMAVDVVPDFTDHKATTKVGVITEARLEGKDLCIAGHLFAKDFPQVVRGIQDRARRGTLGASFEITDVAVEDPEAAVWTLQHVVFTGAAILERSKAAYGRTSIIATIGEDPLMTELSEIVKDLKQVSADLAAAGEEGAATDKTAGDADDAARHRAADEAAQTQAAADEAARQQAAEEDAAAARHADDEDAMAGLIARCVKAMGYKKFVEAMAGQAEHEDEEEDERLLERLGLLKRRGRSAAAGGDVMATRQLRRVEKRLDDVTAAMALITDAVKKQSGLITDMVKQARSLATDDAGRGMDEGKRVLAQGQRKTLAAGGEYERWVAKYPQIGEKDRWNEAELSTLLKTHGVDEEKRMAIKLDLIAAGRLL